MVSGKVDVEGMDEALASSSDAYTSSNERSLPSDYRVKSARGKSYLAKAGEVRSLPDPTDMEMESVEGSAPVSDA